MIRGFIYGLVVVLVAAVTAAALNPLPVAEVPAPAAADVPAAANVPTANVPATTGAAGATTGTATATD